MKLEPQSSSVIAAWGYDAEKEILVIEFQNGGVYRYSAVPDWVWELCENCPSKGFVYNKMVKGQYPVERLDV